ncbi:MAG: phosphatase PAP2 family protein [Deltaproteobacteria bacterium]|nr:phosphatase PAP2 family protein [Deltaproteobacteria bacterium]
MPASAAGSAPAAFDCPLSGLGEFCRRNDVRLAEAMWLLAHLFFDLMIVAAWALRGLPQAPRYLALNMATMTAILLLRPAMRRAERGFFWIARQWYPISFFTLFFLECGALVPAIHPREYDAQVAGLDFALFGDLPARFMAWIHHPALSEYLQICYAVYYFLPIIAGIQMMRRLGTKPLADGIAIISIAFYGSYATYFLIPVVGPRFFPPYHEGLSGLWTFDAIRNCLAAGEGRMHDCMPSAHTSITLLTLFFAWRSHRPTFWALLPIASGLIFSTVYLRYHYVVDVIAAVPFTYAAVRLGGVLVRRWDRLRGARDEPRFLPDPT